VDAAAEVVTLDGEPLALDVNCELPHNSLFLL
jgi:hypothetical protein